MPRERRPQSKFKAGQSFFKDEALDNGSDLKGQPGSPSSKKRRPTNLQSQGNSSLPDLVPPPPVTGYGETIVASNPFDDSLQSCNRPSLGPVPTGSGGGPHQHQRSGPPTIHNQAVGPNPATAAAAMHAKPVPMSSGKIYPHDQPMVFNPQNPNAPPIYPCGICHKEVHDNDQAILCESGCNFWFHRSCTGLSELAYVLLTAEVYAEWVCDECFRSKDVPLVKFKP